MRRPLAELSPILAGVFLTFSTGCYHMYSQPYGYSSGAPMGTTYPGTMQYGAPIQTLTPGQPYVPGGTYQALPQGGTPTYQGGGLQPIPENNAPNYQNSTPTTPNSNPNPQTPDPYFPNTYNAPTGLKSIQPTAFQEPAPLNPPAAALREVRSLPTDYVPRTAEPTAMAAGPESSISAPAPASGMAPMNAAPATASSAVPVPSADAIPTAPPVADAFALPVMSPPPASNAVPAAPPAVPDQFAAPVAPAGAQSLFDVETRKVVTADTPTFDHDTKFQWLRGVVAKDPQDQTWSIVYDDQPATDDKWGGHLSLAPSPYLENLRDGDVVEVRGQLDGVVHDRLGKPVYVVSALQKPASAQK